MTSCPPCGLLEHEVRRHITTPLILIADIFPSPFEISSSYISPFDRPYRVGELVSLAALLHTSTPSGALSADMSSGS